ncbi:hypothetical protein AKO1_009947 [Acrasis kona]|uniref:MRH domain-containing protein n=1 Tax=Acrasis kona TaxID=1008807 RepID=A0AAW2ZR97_9EUKA
MDDIGSRFTECSGGKKTLFYYYKPPATCISNQSLPQPLYNVPCNFKCRPGQFLNSTSANCQQCPGGSYSDAGLVTFNKWDKLPAQFSTTCERTSFFSSSACEPWTLHAGYIDSGNNWNARSISSNLMYTFEVTESQGTISFEYQVSSEEGYDHLSFYMDEEKQFQNSNQQWTLFTMNVTMGFHVAKWKYSKDSTTSYGEDSTKIKSITMSGNADSSLACSQCRMGEYGDGSHPCDKCQEGTFSNVIGATSCKPCPPSYTSYRGATSCYQTSQPCNATDYYSYPSTINNTHTMIHYQWISPILCNISHPASISLPHASLVTSKQQSCKPGQMPNPSLGCDYCAKGHSSTDGTACRPCEQGSSASVASARYDAFDPIRWPHPSINYTTSCTGECRSNGWRSIGRYLDSGINNGISQVQFDLSISFRHIVNVDPRDISVAFEYALSCPSDGSLQFSVDGYLVDSVACGGCASLSSFSTLYLNYMSPGRHVINVNLNTPSAPPQDTYGCSRALIRSILVNGSANDGGAVMCQDCVPGQYSDRVVGQCVSCPDGHVSPVKSDRCTPCEENSFSLSGFEQCVECGRGTRSSVGSGHCALSGANCTFGAKDDLDRDRLFSLSRIDSDVIRNASLGTNDVGVDYYLNLCGDGGVGSCAAIGAKACKYVKDQDEFINIGNEMDFEFVQGQVTSLSLTLTNFKEFCYNNKTGRTQHVKTRVSIVCDATGLNSNPPRALQIDDCNYEYLLKDQKVCALCTIDDYEPVSDNGCLNGKAVEVISYKKKNVTSSDCFGIMNLPDNQVNVCASGSNPLPFHVGWLIGLHISVAVCSRADHLDHSDYLQKVQRRQKKIRTIH